MLITFIENMIAPVFYKLLYMSITALVVGMIVMLIRRFADKRFSPFWKYAMWVLVFVALLIPWRPQSDIAIMNTTEKIQEVSFHQEYQAAQSEYQFRAMVENNTESPSSQYMEAKSKADSLYVKTLIFDHIIPSIWLLGMVIIGLFMILSGLRLGRKIKNTAFPQKTERYENILQSCKSKLGIKRRVQIVFQGYVKTPALFGLFLPKIILPDYVISMSDEHLEYVILHELSHLKRGDGIVNMLLLALQTVYWFNPLTWFLFKFIREDMELANDAAVLKGMGAEQQKEYSLSLVEVLAGYGKPTLAPRLLCMVDSEKNMTRRINMIKLGAFFKRRKIVIAIAGLLVIAVTSTLFLTAGSNPANIGGHHGTIIWAKNLSSNDIERIEAISFDSSEPVQLYKDLSTNEIKQAISFINQTDGSYVENPLVYERDNGLLFITTKDGKVHSVRNHGDMYLIIDSVYWKVDTEWLYSGFKQFTGNRPVPDEFWDRIHSRMVNRAV